MNCTAYNACIRRQCLLVCTCACSVKQTASNLGHTVSRGKWLGQKRWALKHCGPTKCNAYIKMAINIQCIDTPPWASYGDWMICCNRLLRIVLSYTQTYEPGKHAQHIEKHVGTELQRLFWRVLHKNPLAQFRMIFCCYFKITLVANFHKELE